MKTIARVVIIVLGAAGLAGCASHSKPSASAGKPAIAVEPSAVANANTANTSTNTTAKANASTNILGSENARASYAIGMTLGRNFHTQGAEVDAEALARGVKDMMSGGTTLLTLQEMRDTLTEFQKTLMAKQRQKHEELAAKNKVEGETFLATNKNNPGVITLPDGLQYVVITNGTGPMPQSNDVVTVNYRGTLLDGTEFDSSLKNDKPAKFTLGNVIPGWTEALQMMNVGSKWRLFIPPQLAYGERGRPAIPPNAVLTFEVELVATERPAPREPLTSDIVKVPSLDDMKKGAKIEVIKPEDAAKIQASQSQPSATNQPAK